MHAHDIDALSQYPKFRQLMDQSLYTTSGRTAVPNQVVGAK
jgi:hypothetical protein